MANAMWHVRVRVSFPDGSNNVELVSLSSPDLVNTKEAKRRASETAKDRLRRRIFAVHGVRSKGVKFAAIDVQCVG